MVKVVRGCRQFHEAYLLAGLLCVDYRQNQWKDGQRSRSHLVVGGRKVTVGIFVGDGCGVCGVIWLVD